MEEIFDRFPNNIVETGGPIQRQPFTFYYKRFEVWQGGVCVYSGNNSGQIIARILNNELNVVIDDDKINSHIKKQFTFSQISTNSNRILWSKDLFNTEGKTERNNPDISSLFYKQGVLNKVTYTIHDPNTLVEFYS